MDANKTDPGRQALYRRFGQIGFLILVQAVILFLSAGKLNWSAAWIYMGLYWPLLPPTPSSCYRARRRGG